MITFTVRPDSGDEYQVEATTRDILNWERTTKGASFGKLEEDAHLADMYAIAWHAARRQSMFTGTLKAFEETNDLVFTRDGDDSGEDVAPRPTRKGR